jgi:hypothetical protein
MTCYRFSSGNMAINLPVEMIIEPVTTGRKQVQGIAPFMNYV